MIALNITIEQHGPHVAITYHAAEDATSTAVEGETVAEIVVLIQAHVAKRGGDGSFVERKDDAPDFRQGGYGG